MTSQPGVSNQSSTWARAMFIFNAELTKDDKKRLDTSQQPIASFDDIQNMVKVQVDEWEAGKWKFKDIVLQDKVHRLLTQLSTYAIAGDIIIQQHPEFTAIAWGAFRFLLAVATSRSDAAEFLADHLQHITGIFGRARQYEQLYLGRSPRLTEAIPRLFAHVLNFLIRARIFFSRNMLSQVWYLMKHPLRAHFEPLVDHIKHYEQVVERESHLMLHTGTTHQRMWNRRIEEYD